RRCCLASAGLHNTFADGGRRSAIILENGCGYTGGERFLFTSTTAELRVNARGILRAPNDTLAKLQTAPHTSGDAARPLPRLTFVWRERTATDVTPSQMSLPRRFSAGPKNRRFASFS